jgi:hypothetical protein
MEAAAGSRGYELLLAHCELLETLDAERSSSFERLTASVGGRLARLLVSALAGDHRMQPQREQH